VVKTIIGPLGAHAGDRQCLGAARRPKGVAAVGMPAAGGLLVVGAEDEWFLGVSQLTDESLIVWMCSRGGGRCAVLPVVPAAQHLEMCPRWTGGG
jgi:hypothetical protein